MQEFYKGELKELVYEFFLRFSRFEFALKESNYVKANNHSDVAEVHWNKIIHEFEKNYVIDDIEIELLQKPPMKQVYVNNELEWVGFNFPNNASDLKKLTFALRTMRNNLFHGGKFGHQSWDDPARVTFVLSSGLHCLDKISSLSIDLNAHYNGEY